MGKVRVITDSNAYLSPKLTANHKIEVIPHRIKIGGAFYEEGVNFTTDDLFRKLRDTQGIG